MNTLKALSLTALLGASILGNLASTEDRFGGFATGAMIRVDGITRPAPAQRPSAPTPSPSSAQPAPERLLGSLVRDDSGRVTPIAPRTAQAQTVADRPSAALGTPADERLLGSFVRHNGIAVPAPLNERMALRTPGVDPLAVAAHPVR